MEFNKHTNILYVCGELDNTVTVLHYNTDLVDLVMAGNYHGDVGSEEKSLVRQVQTVSTLPEGHSSIAVFRVDQASGTLSLVDIQDSHGAFPRHFNFDRTSQFLVVGNHASDNVVAFKILETGRLG